MPNGSKRKNRFVMNLLSQISLCSKRMNKDSIKSSCYILYHTRNPNTRYQRKEYFFCVLKDIKVMTWRF